MENRIKKLIVFLISCVLISIYMCFFVFAEDVTISFSYGIRNVVKSNKQIPIEVKLQNRDNTDFKGYFRINVFESNKSIYIYEYEVDIPEKNTVYKNANISLSDKSSSIEIELFNNREEKVSSVKNIIDTSFNNDKIIVGVISEDFEKLMYLDNITLKNYPFRTKLVEISADDFDKNRTILDYVDLLLIDDINFPMLDETNKYSINSYLESGKPAIIGLGGNNGAFSLPSFLDNSLSGPIFDNTENTIYGYNFNVTHFDFLNSNKLIEVNDNLYIESINENGLNIVCLPFSIVELNNNRLYETFFENIITNAIGKSKLNALSDNITNKVRNDYYSVNSLLSIIGKLKLPDIFVFTLFLVFYISFITILVYVVLRNMNLRILYGRIIFIIGFITTLFLFVFGIARVRKTTFLNYISIVEINDTGTNEKAFLNFMTNDGSKYSFTTSLNNKIFPLIEPMQDNQNVNTNNKNVKKTLFSKEKNRNKVEIENSSEFDSNIFVYENGSYLNNIYDIDVSITKNNDILSGRITNKMNAKIQDACIVAFGQIVNLGDIDSKKSLLLKENKETRVPIGNNAMLTDMISKSEYKNIIRYYLDENVYGYYDYGLLLGFIDKNETIDLDSNDVSDIYGRTLLVKKVNFTKNRIKTDYCSLDNEVINVSGFYDEKNNSITGENEVINEYSFGKNIKLIKILIKKLKDFEYDNIEYNIPFYGKMAILNIEKNIFEEVDDEEISGVKLDSYLTDDNRILIKYIPSGRDPLYRYQSLPIVWGVVE